MLTKSEFFEVLNNRLCETCPLTIFEFSLSKKEHFWRDYREGTPWEIKFDQSIAYISTLRNFPLFWYRLGITDLSEIKKYSSSMTWRVCKICNEIYSQDECIVDDFKASNTCSLECNAKSRINQGRLVSKARNEYNSRDPEQYANRHNISIESAKEIIDNINNSGSKRRTEYWIKRGYSEDAAIAIISKIQKECSPRNKEYWLSKGMSEEDSARAISEFQSERSTDNPKKLYFYIKKGISEADGNKLISEIICNTPAFVLSSKIANEFNEELVQHFLDDIQYTDYLNREYSVYSNEHLRAFYYDYVNDSKKFVVEFNGNYWHSSANSRWTQEFDDVKNKVMEDRGYKVFTVWEKDYRFSIPGEFVKQVVSEIKDWYENSEH